MRKDALDGIAELLQAHPEALVASAATVVVKVAARLVDREKVARDAARAALGLGVLPALGPRGLAPFAPALILHVGAALTHVHPAVRRDAPGALDAILDVAPDLSPPTTRPRPSGTSPSSSGEETTPPHRRSSRRRTKREPKTRRVTTVMTTGLGRTRGAASLAVRGHDCVEVGPQAPDAEAQAAHLVPPVPRGARAKAREGERRVGDRDRRIDGSIDRAGDDDVAVGPRRRS